MYIHIVQRSQQTNFQSETTKSVAMITEKFMILKEVAVNRIKVRDVMSLSRWLERFERDES